MFQKIWNIAVAAARQLPLTRRLVPPVLHKNAVPIGWTLLQTRLQAQYLPLAIRSPGYRGYASFVKAATRPIFASQTTPWYQEDGRYRYPVHRGGGDFAGELLRRQYFDHNPEVCLKVTENQQIDPLPTEKNPHHQGRSCVAQSVSVQLESSSHATNFLTQPARHSILLTALLAQPGSVDVDRFRSQNADSFVFVSRHLLDDQFMSQFQEMGRDHVRHHTEVKGLLEALRKHGYLEIVVNNQNPALTELSVAVPWPHREAPDSIEVAHVLNYLGIAEFQNCLDVSIVPVEERKVVASPELDRAPPVEMRDSLASFIAHLETESERRYRDKKIALLQL